MKCTPLSLIALLFLTLPVQAESYIHVPGWLKPPADREHIGNLHGEVDVDSKGMIYLSVEGNNGSLQVFRPDGSYSHSVPNMPMTLHGFVIKDDFIYASVLGEGKVIKATLDGKIVLEIPQGAQMALRCVTQMSLRPHELGRQLSSPILPSHCLRR